MIMNRKRKNSISKREEPPTMDENLTDFCRKHLSKFREINPSVLREELERLERRCRDEFSLNDESTNVVNRKLWLKLIEFSLELENIELALILVAKLRLSPLAWLLRSIIKIPDKSSNILALAHVANYFDLKEQCKQFECKIISDIALVDDANCKSISHLVDFDDKLDFFVSSNKWDTCLEIIDTKLKREHLRNLKRTVINYRMAQFYETDGDYRQALVHYEKSGTQRDNSCRIITKRSFEKAYRDFRDYSLANEGVMHGFWSNYAMACESFVDANFIHESNNDLASQIKCNILRQFPNPEIPLNQVMPAKIQDFLNNSNSRNRWDNKRELDVLKSLTSSMNSNERSGLSELANHYCRIGCLKRAAGLYFCFDEPNIFLNLASEFSHPCDYIGLAADYGSHRQIAVGLIDFVTRILSQPRDPVREANQDNEGQMREALFTSCLKLGILNESLEFYSRDLYRDEREMAQAVQYLELLIENRKSGALNHVNPVLESSTIKRFRNSLDGSQIQSTHVITIVILSLTIFIYKLVAKPDDQSYFYIVRIETIFDQLSLAFGELDFNASDSLIRSMLALINVVKERLELIAESDVIRGQFKNLVQATAERCMIESRYKSAAMLYSHIEDNVSAVKSLMRLGDVDVVINYSLLVHDISVNRITINFLRHSNVDSSVLENFIAKTNHQTS